MIDFDSIMQDISIYFSQKSIASEANQGQSRDLYLDLKRSARHLSSQHTYVELSLYSSHK